MFEGIRNAESWRRVAGELLVIVAGVLIALWIEDWRQARLDRQAEAQYLARLAVDLEEDQERLAGMIRGLEHRVERARGALAFLDSDRSTGDTATIDDFHYAGFINFFHHRRATMDDLLSTGNLTLIRDKELQREITVYYRSADFLDDFGHVKRQSVWETYRPEVSVYIPPLVLTLVDREDRELSAQELNRVNWVGLKGDPRIRTHLESAITIANVERRQVERVVEQAERLRVRILAKTSEVP